MDGWMDRQIYFKNDGRFSLPYLFQEGDQFYPSKKCHLVNVGWVVLHFHCHRRLHISDAHGSHTSIVDSSERVHACSIYEPITIKHVLRYSLWTTIFVRSNGFTHKDTRVSVANNFAALK